MKYEQNNKKKYIDLIDKWVRLLKGFK